MNDPTRLLDDHELRPTQRELLTSAKGEVPGDAVLRVLLGSVAAGSLATSLTETSANAATAPAAPTPRLPGLESHAPTPLATPILGSSSIGWIGLGVGLVTVGALTLGRLHEPPRSVDSGARVAPRGATVVEAPEVLTSERTPAAPPEPVSPSSPPRGSATARQPESRERRASLADEVSALENVRAALRARNAERSLALLRTYAERFPRGMLKPEAEALRADAHALVETSAPAAPQSREHGQNRKRGRQN